MPLFIKDLPENIKKHHFLVNRRKMATVREMNLTFTAKAGIRAAGMAQAEALGIVQGLTRKDFYKSMTTHADHRIWQDAYHGRWNGIALYIKFQRAGEYFVISFKEL